MILIETRINKKVKLEASKQALLFYAKVLCFVVVAIAATGIIILISKLDTTVGVSLIVAGVLVPLFILGMSYLSIKRKINKANDEEEPAVQTLVFEDDKLLLSESGKTFSAHNNEIAYSLIIKAVETSEYIILFLNALMVIIADKSGIKEGNIEELRALLKTKLDKKFACKIEKAK